LAQALEAAAFAAMFAGKKGGKTGEGRGHLPPGGGRPPSKQQQDDDGSSMYSGRGTTAVEYNRWLVAEENWNVAEDSRQTLNQIRSFRNAVKEDRLNRGRIRAETSRAQRGDAQKRIIENSEVKAAIGTEIRSQVGNWNEQASTQRRAWSDYGSSLKTKLNPDHKKIQAEFSAQKEKMAKEMRQNRDAVEAMREQVIHQIEESNRQSVLKVRAETAPAVTDDAKRFFYTQRKKIADSTVKMEEAWVKEIQNHKQAHLRRATEGVEAAKSTRHQARDARSELETRRALEAKEVREKQRAMREKKAKESSEYLKTTREKRNVLFGQKFITNDMTERMHGHTQYKLLTSVMNDPKPSRSNFSDTRSEASASTIR